MKSEDLLNIIDGASLTMKAEGDGIMSIEAKGSGVALIIMAAVCLALLCSQMEDAAQTEKNIHKLAKKIIESSISGKEAED